MGLALYNPMDTMPDVKDDKQESSPGSSPRCSPQRQDHGDRRSRSPPNVNREHVRHRMRDRPGNTALDAAHWLHRHADPAENDGSAQSLPVRSPRRRPRSRLAWTSYVNEGADLIMPRLTPDARVQSPRSDRSRNSDDGDGNSPAAEGGRTSPRRPPSLERQEAFLAPGTSTTRQRGSDDSRAVNVDGDNDDDFENIEAEDITHLYELGLLYDDEHLRGAAFGFDALASSGGGGDRQHALDVCRGVQRTRVTRRRKTPPALERPLYGGGFPIRIRRAHSADRDPASAPDDGIDNYDIAPGADELVAYDHDGLADDNLGFVEVPDASGYPDLVYDSDLSDEDDGKSSSGWVIMRDSSERAPARTAQ